MADYTYTIFLDAGHGGSDPGAVYNGRREKDDTLALTLAIGDILESYGFNVKSVSYTHLLLFSYILTGGFLLLLALFLYKFQLSEKVVSIAIIGIYVVAVFFAGFMTGKRMGSKKFLWGLAVGLAYFAVMALVSFAANHGFKDLGTHFFTTLAICAAGGMLGGMLS